MAQAGVSANRLELLQIADAVAREKTIDRRIVIAAMEDAIQKAAKSRYGSENDIRCEIDAKTGETKLTRVLEVVENVDNEHVARQAQLALLRIDLGMHVSLAAVTGAGGLGDGVFHRGDHDAAVDRFLARNRVCDLQQF